MKLPLRLHLACLALLLGPATALFAQGGTPAHIVPTAGTPVSAPVNAVMAGHVFHQRGDGTANVAVNYDFVHNTFQDSPNLRVHGKPFSVAFWYRSTQNVSFGLIWDNGEVGTTGYVVGLNNGYISVTEINSGTGCSFFWSNASTVTNDGQWHHAAIVADRNANSTYVYRDGTLDTTLGYCDPADDTSNGGNQWYGIGRNSNQFDFAGDIDHFTAWVGVALTPAEVNAHLNGGMPEFASVGVWYEFENANGQRVPDLGPNHYDGHVSPDATALVGPGPAFQALVTDADNNPVPDVAVTFTAPASGASGTFTSELRSATATTDASGTATAPTFTANSVAGPYDVAATVIGVTARANFSAANLAGSPESILATAGTPQHAAIGTVFAVALGATVKDADGNPVPAAKVTFTAPASGASGTFPGGVTMATSFTDTSGVATAPTFTANSLVGSYVVDATVTGVLTAANFSLTNKQARTTTEVVASPNPSYPGQPVTFTAAVTSAGGLVPAGTVIFRHGKTVYGRGALDSSGQVSITTSSLRVGKYHVHAVYEGNSNFRESTGSVKVDVIRHTE